MFAVLELLLGYISSTRVVTRLLAVLELLLGYKLYYGYRVTRVTRVIGVARELLVLF